MHGIVVLLTVLICVSGVRNYASAQSLQNALASVYTSHPALLAARAHLRATDENVPQALAGWRPTVTITGAYGYTGSRNRSRATLPDGSSGSFYQDLFLAPTNGALVISQPVYQGGRTIAATLRAESQVLAQRARLLVTEQQVLYGAIAAYVNLLRDTELLRLNQDYVRLLEQQQAAILRRYDAGEVTRTDALQTESRRYTAQGNLEAARGALEISRGAFLRAVGRPPGQLSPPQPLQPVASDLDALRETAAQENPLVVASFFDEWAARHAVDVQFSQLMPQLNLQAQAYRNDNPGARGTRNSGQMLTLNLSVPLYQGGSEYAAVRQARHGAQQARQLLEEQRWQAVQEGVQAWQTYRSAQAQADASRRAIRALLGAQDGVRREALIGGRTTIEVLNAELELVNARIALLGTVANIVTSSYAMAAAVGRLTAQDLQLPVQTYDWEANYRRARTRLFGLGD